MVSSQNRGRASMRRAANPEKKLRALEAAVGKITNKTIAKKTVQKPKKRSDPDEMMRRARIYHKLKKEVLAPFIARLLIRHRWEEMTDNLEEEFTMFDLHTTGQPSRGGNSTVNFTLNAINEEEEEDKESEASHEDDWRKEKERGSGSSSSSGPSDSE